MIPGSFIFKTAVASLKLARNAHDIYKMEKFKERGIAICGQNGDLVKWLSKVSVDWIDAHLGNEETYDFIAICGALEG
jgi:hypothetical protein